MNDKEAGSVVLIGTDIPTLFRRTADALEQMEVLVSDVKSVVIMTPRNEPEKRMIEVEFNNEHDPANCRGCDYERAHPEWKRPTE